MITFFENGLASLASGGPIIWPLMFSGFLLAYALGARATLLFGPVVPNTSRILSGLRMVGVRRAPHIEEKLAPVREELSSMKTTIRSLVTIAPLLGLLGTVSGMIETFDSLADMALFTQTGGIAGGISQALLTTQLGLSIAIPGLLLSRILDRRAQRLETEITILADQFAVGGEA